jgi:hypothetical protein
MMAGRGEGIKLDTPFHWAIDGLKQRAPFFEHLPSLLPSDSILYVEGVRTAPEVAAFYSSHRARNAVDVARDSIWPVPDIYQFSFSSDVSARLRQFAEARPGLELRAPKTRIYVNSHSMKPREMGPGPARRKNGFSSPAARASAISSHWFTLSTA